MIIISHHSLFVFRCSLFVPENFQLIGVAKRPHEGCPAFHVYEKIFGVPEHAELVFPDPSKCLIILINTIVSCD